MNTGRGRRDKACLVCTESDIFPGNNNFYAIEEARHALPVLQEINIYAIEKEDIK